MPVDLLCLDEIPVVREVDTQEETELEEDENPQDQYRANEITSIPTIPCETSEESVTMAPGEGVLLIFILTDTL